MTQALNDQPRPPTPVRASPGLTVLPPLYPAPSGHTGNGSAGLAPKSAALARSSAGDQGHDEQGHGPATRPVRVVLPMPPGGPEVGALPSSGRNAVLMAAGTGLSRVTGFARTLAVIWVLGQHALADAYNLANTLPNLVYELLLGGVLSATLLPVLMQALAKRAVDEDDESVSAIVTVITVVLVLGTVIFWLAAPLLMDLYLALSSGAGSGPEKALATSWLRLFTPQLLFIGLTAVSNALLNARRRFASVAFSPVIANVVTIAALVVADRMVANPSVHSYRTSTTALMVVGLGTTAGYALQLLCQVPAMLRCNLHLRLVWRPSDPALRTIARLSSWTLGVVLANQVSYSVCALLANQRSGNYSAFTYAYTFMQLPYAIVAVSVAYAVAPDLAQLWSEGRAQAFADRVSYALKVVCVLLVPGGVGYALVAHPAVVVATAHGHESLSSAGLTGSLLAIFALGLPGFSAFLVLMRAFQSQQDTRSMFWLYLVENTLTVSAAAVLYPFIGVKALAAAWIGCYTLTIPLAWRKLRLSAPVGLSGGWLSRLLLATGVMAVAVSLVSTVVPAGRTFEPQFVRLVLLVVTGGTVFWLSAHVMGIRELAALKERLRYMGRSAA